MPADAIRLDSILPIEDPNTFKLHLASWNGTIDPLDVFVRSRTEWDGWNAWRSTRDDFSRSYIFALIDFYAQPGTWLFGGAYRVLDRKPIDNAESYTIDRLPDYEKYVGRLKVRFTRPGRTKALNFENHYAQIEVCEILAEPYSGEAFPGYDRLQVGFAQLETVVSMQKPDWKAALENTKGVYLITDSHNGKQYVGSAYGETGIWTRWSCYTSTGHGYNDELTAIVRDHGIEYARSHFLFSILEICSMKTEDRVVIAREQHWKSVLMTREHGYNKN